MFKTCSCLISASILMVFIALPVFGFGGGGMSTAEPVAPVITGEMIELTIPIRHHQTGKIQQVSLFSEDDARLPVATVDGEPITLRELALELARMHNNMESDVAPGSQSFSKILERLITIKLVKQEALNIGFDRTPEVQNQVDNFALKSMIQPMLAKQIADIQVPAADVDELYQKMAIEAKLLTYSFEVEGDAKMLLTKVQDGGDFQQLADELIKQGKAVGGETPEFARLNDLFPAVAQAVFAMEPGGVSEVFKGEKGFLLFRLEARRVYEDKEVRQKAVDRLRRQLANKKQLDYLDSLVAKYATFHTEVEADLDFVKISEGNPQVKGADILPRLIADKRPLVTISNGSETQVITVSEIADKVKVSMYHGMDRVIDGKALDREKENAIRNRVIAIAGRMEAEVQGMDQTLEFKEAVRNFQDRVLFDTFIAKAVVPGITVPEDDVKKYYYNHLEDYSSPLMLKMKSLTFTNEADAQNAFQKLQAGSDFQWVSANSAGQADSDHKDLLYLGDKLLSATALPEKLQKQVTGARAGDFFFFAGPADLFYALLVESAFEPKAKTYQEVRQEVAKIVYGEKINEALVDWVNKLKEVYETEVFIVQEKL